MVKIIIFLRIVGEQIGVNRIRIKLDSFFTNNLKIIYLFIKGDNGYMLFARNKNNSCNIAYASFYPTVAKEINQNSG